MGWVLYNIDLRYIIFPKLVETVRYSWNGFLVLVFLARWVWVIFLVRKADIACVNRNSDSRLELSTNSWGFIYFCWAVLLVCRIILILFAGGIVYVIWHVRKLLIFSMFVPKLLGSVKCLWFFLWNADVPFQMIFFI